jgi:hypothetical protein
VTQEGVEVDAHELDVRTGLEVLAWNIAGAAPLYLATVVYGPKAGNPPPPTFFCGRKTVSAREVDYLFREPPSSMRLSKSESRTTRSHMGIAPQDADSPLACLTVLTLEERRRLVEQARRDDWLRGTVSEAIASWAP